MMTRAELTGRRKLVSFFFLKMVIIGLPFINVTGSVCFSRCLFENLSLFFEFFRFLGLYPIVIVD